MKKKMFFLFLFVMMIIPTKVYAIDTTKKLYIKMDVQRDGSVDVEEIAELSGEYNGRLRDISYRNLKAPLFSGKESDFRGSDIYNASSLTNLKVCETAPSITKDSFGKCQNEYREVDYASSGQYGIYEKTETLEGISLKIFNPSNRHKAFYLSYTLTDVVVVHEDVAELAWNILGNSYQENIDDLKVWINLPDKDSDLRVFLKGNENTLNGEIEREDNRTAYVYFDFLGAYNAISVRMMFDKNIVPEATKFSHVNGRENILKVEKEDAEQANLIREKIRNQNNFILGMTLLWYLITTAFLIWYFYKRKKNKKTTFDHPYYRDFPADYGPEILEYLLKKNISDLGMSASILNIIDKKVLKVTENPKVKKDYILTLADKEMKNLTESEKMLCDFFIQEIGNGSEVSLDQIRTYSKKNKTALQLIEHYDSWKKMAKKEAKTYHFFTGYQRCQYFCSFFGGVLSFVISFLNLAYETSSFFGFFAPLYGIIVLIIANLYSFRTQNGAIEYEKWMAFKRFIKDFGTLDEKELPEITLWGRYLVYATVLGCADEVEDAMKLKFDTISTVETGYPYYSTFDQINDINFYITSGIYYSIHHSVQNAVSASRSSIASSSSSSSSGFGGGSSFGGGSFGGGGGGGRF